MNEQQILELITMGVDVAQRVTALITELKAQKGITDEQLKAYVQDKDAALRTRIDAYLDATAGQG